MLVVISDVAEVPIMTLPLRQLDHRISPQQGNALAGVV